MIMEPRLERKIRRSGPRVTNACEQCRSKRTKCDGAKPRCQGCVRLDVPCNYVAVDGRRVRHKESEVAALLDRISYLEDKLQEATRKATGSMTGQSSDSVPVDLIYDLDQDYYSVQSVNNNAAKEDIDFSQYFSTQWEAELQNLSSTTLPSTTSNISRETICFASEPHAFLGNTEDSQGLLSVEEQATSRTAAANSSMNALTDLVSVMGDLQLDEDSGGTRYFGPTSNFHMMRFPSQPASVGKTSPESEDIPIVQMAYLLTKQDEAALSSFWVDVHPYLPVFGLGEPPGPLAEKEGISMVTCMALSLGYFFQKSDEMPGSVDNAYFAAQYHMEHFTSLLGREVDHVCLSNVRAFLLRGYLATFQGKIESATIFTGIACGVAKRLGLHVRSSSFLLDPARETAGRKVFHACLWMDRRLAMLEGRATFLTKCDISERTPMEEIKDNPDVSFMDMELSLELIYACHIEFANLQDGCLAEIYSFSNSLRKDDAISKGHVTYMTWYNSLPLSMRRISNGQGFHPSFLSFHLCFHSGLIQLHRPSLKDSGARSTTSQYYCRESAKTIASLLKRYRQHFDNRVMDFMVIHSAFTGALVHLVLLEHPHIASYHTSIRGFRTIIEILRWIMPRSGYARKVHDNIRDIAFTWGISPVNSPAFWAADMSE